MAIVYKELGQPCNVKHSIELGWDVNENAAMPPLLDIGPHFLQCFNCSGTEVLMPNSWKKRRRMPRATCVHIHRLASILSVHTQKHIKEVLLGFPGGTVVENLPANAGDTGLSPGPGRSHMPQSN